MNIDDTHWHDCVIHRVIEDTLHDTISFEVGCPNEAEYKKCKLLIFKEILNYEIHEGPFSGSPTILDVIVLEQEGHRQTLKIDTNAGYRLLKCSEIEAK